MSQSTFRSAITESDGVSVNIGYLSLWNLMLLDAALSVALIAAGFMAQVWDPHHAFPFTGVAAALAATWGTFATALGAVGLFLLGDRRGGASSTSTTIEHREGGQALPPAPLAAAAPAGDAKALTPQIEQSDVGKNVVIESAAESAPPAVKRKGPRA